MKHLIAIQGELKAPKGQYNSFGKYKYRSAEDILEAVKPICHKNGCVLTLSDELCYIGERYYIKATATLTTPESVFSVTAYAREEESKKGMDGSQITGTASSYSRKYALNGLFCIDDQKDADTDAYKKQQEKTDEWKQLRQEVIDCAKKKGVPIEEVLKVAKVDSLDNLSAQRLNGALAWLNKEEA